MTPMSLSCCAARSASSLVLLCRTLASTARCSESRSAATSLSSTRTRDSVASRCFMRASVHSSRFMSGW